MPHYLPLLLHTVVRMLCFYFTVDRQTTSAVDQFVSSSETRWQQLQIEVTSMQTLLEQTVTSWQQYAKCLEELSAWLNAAEQIVFGGAEGREVSLVFFSVMINLFAQLFGTVLFTSVIVVTSPGSELMSLRMVKVNLIAFNSILQCWRTLKIR
jgi:hypothetical protein